MIIAVDFDGTLTIEVGVRNDPSTWVPTHDKKPNEKIVGWINKMFKEGHTIIVHTARWQSEYAKVRAWLEVNKVAYHAIVCGKLIADVYLDDKAMKLEDVNL